MQIQINTDKHVQRDPSVVQHVERTIDAVLGRFGNSITRIEVHLSDANAERRGSNDRRCTLEARVTGHPPVAVHDSADSIAGAITGAARKLQHALDSTLSRQSRPPAPALE